MFKILIDGDYALFTRPEYKVERVTYPFPTPSALIGILKSIYWKPSIKYVIDKIIVYKKIDYVNIRRNEVKEKISKNNTICQMNNGDKTPVIYTKDCISQRSSMILKNIKYGIEFHFELTGIRCERETDAENKHASIIRRRIEKGQCFRQPCFGCREFPVKNILLVDEFPPVEEPSFNGIYDPGVMLYDLEFHDNVKLKENWNSIYFSDSADPRFYHPLMIDGIIDVQKYRGTKL